MIELDARSSALVLIDLQKGILGWPLAPRSGNDILEAGKALAHRFREAGSPVVLVNVGWSANHADSLQQAVDKPNVRPQEGYPPDWSELADGLAEDGDLRITKRQWGAFHGTELDLQLRRRGIRTLVIGGVATNFGVESTVRQAWEHGYAVVLAEDATTSVSKELHDMAVHNVFPRISRVAKESGEIEFGKT